MKLIRLHIDHFGKLSDKTIEFSDGLNVISGVNESGKSTLHTFIHAMLLGLERGRGRAAKTDTYSHYKPWDGGRYGGTLTLEHEGENITIVRDFGPENPSCTIIRDEDGRKLPATESVLRELTGGLTEGLYKNTISVGQLSAGTDKELAEELRNHIVNLKNSGSYSLDVAGAVGRLQSVRKKISATYDKDAEERAEQLRTRARNLEESIRHNAPGQEAAGLTGKTNAIAEQMGIYEDEAEDLLRRNKSLREKNPRLCKKAAAVLLWTAEIILLSGIAGCGYLGYVQYCRSGLGLQLVPYALPAAGCLVMTIIGAVLLKKSGSCRAGIRANDTRHKELLGLIAETQKELLQLSDEKEREQKFQWEREQRQEELSRVNCEIEKLVPVLETNAHIRQEVQALNLAVSTMEDISKNEFAGFGSFLERLASTLIQSITGGAYQGLHIGEDMEVTLLRNGSRVALASVSSGTLDQVYLAVRLACIAFFWEDEDMPLLLDDTFALYDDSRLERTLTWLSEIYEGQAVIFTCHMREAEILEILDIPYTLIKL